MGVRDDPVGRWTPWRIEWVGYRMDPVGWARGGSDPVEDQSVGTEGVPRGQMGTVEVTR